MRLRSKRFPANKITIKFRNKMKAKEMTLSQLIDVMWATVKGRCYLCLHDTLIDLSIITSKMESSEPIFTIYWIVRDNGTHVDYDIKSHRERLAAISPNENPISFTISYQAGIFNLKPIENK